MTNYNKRLDEVFRSAFYRIRIRIMRDAEIYPSHIVQAEVKLKQSITSLIKELVEEAKPGYKPISKYAPSIYSQGFNQAVDDFEQNLLKELEEV